MDSTFTILDTMPPEMPRLTARQLQILKFLFSYYTQNRYYPTQREIAKGVKLSTNNCGAYIDPLIRKGYLERRSLSKGRNLAFTALGLERLKMEGVTKDKPAGKTK
jgi:DNA-binding MarR family transcriptional regulator